MSDHDEIIKAPAAGNGGNARFSTTHWSLVMRAQNQHEEGADQAMEDLCRTYWYPLYAFLRRSGNSPEDSQDLTQDFFRQLLEKDRLASADPAKGKFRSFLLVSIKNLANTEWKRSQAQKRGGGKQIISLDDGEPETRYLREPSHLDTPERLYEQRWAQILVAPGAGSHPTRMRGTRETVRRVEVVPGESTRCRHFRRGGRKTWRIRGSPEVHGASAAQTLR